MANRTLAIVRKMFNFAIERDWIDVNPCHMVKRVVREKPRDRVLTDDEIRAVWTALDDEDQLMASLIRLRLLTAQRGGELHGARWEEVDLTTAWWTISGNRSKNGLSHRVPLSLQALQLFRELHDYRLEHAKRDENGEVQLSPWVFPSPRKTGPHVRHAQKAFERLVARSGVKFRGHDLRRTAASLMVGGGVPGRRHALIFVSEKSRLPVLISIREANKLRVSFPDAACRMLAFVGVPASDIDRERAQMSAIAFGRTKSRSLLGTLNDFSFGARVHFVTSPQGSLEDIARWLAKTPILPLKGASPIELTRARFGDG